MSDKESFDYEEFGSEDENTGESILSEDDLRELILSGDANPVDIREMQDDEYKSPVIKQEDTHSENISEYGPEEHERGDVDVDDDVKEYLLQNFKDFLEYPKISGKEKFSASNIIQKEKTDSLKEKVEVYNEPEIEDEHGTTTVELNKNERGEVESILIYCKCGEKTLIRFDYDDSAAKKEES
jgi:hypothetical protein